MSGLEEKSKALQSETAKENDGQVSKESSAAGLQSITDQFSNDENIPADQQKKESMSEASKQHGGQVPKGSRASGVQKGADIIAKMDSETEEQKGDEEKKNKDEEEGDDEADN